jgi:hypothetical protein
LPACDTPHDAEAFPPRPDGYSSAAIADLAAAAWRSVARPIAGTPHVRISRDGGRTYPARHARPLPAAPPGQPCTVPVYDPGSATGRMLALDLDPARGDVDRQVAELGQLLEHHGARVLADLSPSGGWRVLSTSLSKASAAVERPNGPQAWNVLLTEFAAELQQVLRHHGVNQHGDNQPAAELDAAGVAWVPRLGGRACLGAELEHVARTGRWERSRYAGRSEARMAILSAAAARGWRLADVRLAIACGAWKGSSRPAREALRARPSRSSPARRVAKSRRLPQRGEKRAR